MTEYMKTPWHILADPVLGFVIMDVCGNVVPVDTSDMSNYIIRCVNSHDALVAALKGLANYKEIVMDYAGEHAFPLHEVQADFADANTAIAAAEGEATP